MKTEPKKAAKAAKAAEKKAAKAAKAAEKKAAGKRNRGGQPGNSNKRGKTKGRHGRCRLCGHGCQTDRSKCRKCKGPS